jgi:hypothetical protein
MIVTEDSAAKPGDFLGELARLLAERKPATEVHAREPAEQLAVDVTKGT